MVCGESEPSASFTLSNSPIVRDVLDNGLRILTEPMTQVRSVSIGVWLTRGSRHETAERGGIAHFVEHMLFKGTAHAVGRGHRPGDRLDRRAARRVHREGIRELLHQGARRAPAAGARHPLRHRPATRRSARRTSSARRRSSSKRSRWWRTRRTIWSTRCSRRASGRTIRSAGRFSARARPSSRSPPTLLRDYFRNAYTPRNLIVSAVGNLEHERVRDLVEREVRDRCRGRRALWRGGAARGAEGPDSQQGARAEPRVSRRRAAIRRTTTIAMRATC